MTKISVSVLIAVIMCLFDTYEGFALDNKDVHPIATYNSIEMVGQIYGKYFYDELYNYRGNSNYTSLLTQSSTCEGTYAEDEIYDAPIPGTAWVSSPPYSSYTGLFAVADHFYHVGNDGQGLTGC